MQRWTLVVLFSLAITTPATAQSLRSLVDQLFIFGTGEDPLFLAGTADPNNPAGVQAHGAHFIPSAVENNGSLIQFLASALGSSVANIPIGATSSGLTFSFVGGVPTATSTSPGPIFAERAQTLGKGRVLVGASITRFRFSSVRGVPLDNVLLNFTHANADFPGCDTIFGGDCTLVGIPGLENDFMRLNLDLNMDVTAQVFVLTYGLLDNVDIGVAVPLISTNLRGTSTAQVVPFGGSTATHFFAGTPDNAELSATRFIDGSATGIGDVAARLKIRLVQGENAAFAVLADGRFPTGSTEDLLGSGETVIRGVGIVSASFGDFSPHANVGYLYRSGDAFANAVLATVGFDHRLSDWAALAIDVVSEFQAGTSPLVLPEEHRFDFPFRRSVSPSNIPDMRDDIVNASVGFKFTAAPGLVVVANSLWPLNKGGLRPSTAWTAGLEYSF